MRFLLAVLLVLTGCQSLVIPIGPDKNTSSIDIEVDWATEQPPPSIVLADIAGKIKGFCDPSVTVNMIIGESHYGHRVWSELDLREFALSHKTNDAFYMIWANGQYEDGPGVGGYSWDKRCFAVFAEQVSGGGLSIAAAHELGHCLGLVGKYIQMVEPHKHEYGNHCNQPLCIMLPSTYGSRPCQKCLQDLEASVEK